ncbi:hypothetical protein FE257_011953 [Aspergillus nanangensis]|uniref:Protein root UVB sensitive/RUS domain-containing protein n=1 Tax=Aspergillus nanangensis TaxID=2582783 RepID=A0AAD4CGW5_ASPNN|nr:hypothetical protein FE257_011953 [Aspergillus nanangensis]
MAQNSNNHLTFMEVDEVNNPIATYIYSAPPEHPQDDQGRRGRIDKMDSLQAFSSSIAGLLSSRAVLQGVGVGNANASPTSALLLHILQDTSGRIATILFAHRVGTALEPECKMYRLAADIFNDAAMVLDCLSPMIPAGIPRVAVLSMAGVLRALCGVAGGSSKASLSAHFSRWGNLAEVNAKDSSQETIISLIGMLVGSFVVSHVTSYPATWISLLLLLSLHLSLNYAAVRAVQMTSLNRQRANIVFSTLLDSDPSLGVLYPNQPTTSPRTLSQENGPEILTPAQVARQEKIFERDGLLKWSSPTRPKTIGSCRIGVSVGGFLQAVSPPASSFYSAGGGSKTHIPMETLVSLFEAEEYILFLGRGSSAWNAAILLKGNTTPRSQLKAWMHALLAARVLSQPDDHGRSRNNKKSPGGPGGEVERILDVLSSTLWFLGDRSRFSGYMEGLTRAGWDINIGALETRSGRRVICNQ